MGLARVKTAPPVPGEFGPNDHHFEGGVMKPGLGADHRDRKLMRAGTLIEEPPDKQELRSKAAALKAVEQEQTRRAAELEEQAAALAEKQAAFEARMHAFEGDDDEPKGKKK